MNNNNNNNKKNDNNKKIAIVLANGSGKRFWPLSNSKVPEQFIYLIDNATLFQKSVKLIADMFDKDSMYIVINRIFKQFVTSQTDLIDENNIFTEPLSKQTAPALGLALTLIDDKYDDDAIICVFPTDQLIKNIQEYYYAVDTACVAAADLEALITIGIKPDRPSINFGYIQFVDDKNDRKNAKIAEELFNSGIRRSINFAEKPIFETAQRFVNSGDFIWNSGILVAKKGVLKKEFQKNLTYHYEKFQELKKLFGTDQFSVELENLYQTFNKTSIDYAILENVDNMYVFKASFSWNNINSWKDIHKVEMKDALDNVLHGNVVAINTSNTLAISNDKLVAIMGLEDVVVINTDKAVLVCKKSDTDNINELVNYIKNSNIPLF